MSPDDVSHDEHGVMEHNTAPFGPLSPAKGARTVRTLAPALPLPLPLRDVARG